MVGPVALDYGAVLAFANLAGDLTPDAAALLKWALPDVEIQMLKGVRRPEGGE